jgi:hypothetical protein
VLEDTILSGFWGIQAHKPIDYIVCDNIKPFVKKYLFFHFQNWNLTEIRSLLEEVSVRFALEDSFRKSIWIFTSWLEISSFQVCWLTFA